MRTTNRWRYPGFSVFTATLITAPLVALQGGPLTGLALLWLVTTALLVIGLGYILGRQTDRLESSSLTDAATGVGNRRLFDLRLEEEAARAMRHGMPLALVLIDLDRLKTINDTYGHQAGDEALRTVASSIALACRRTDVAARIGGDEFAVLAPGATVAQAAELARRIQACLRRHTLRIVAPTVSMGIADLDRARGKGTEALFRAADRALYLAKTSGRDRVLLAPHSSPEEVFAVVEEKATANPTPKEPRADVDSAPSVPRGRLERASTRAIPRRNPSLQEQWRSARWRRPAPQIRDNRGRQ